MAVQPKRVGDEQASFLFHDDCLPVKKSNGICKSGTKVGKQEMGAQDSLQLPILVVEGSRCTYRKIIHDEVLVNRRENRGFPFCCCLIPRSGPWVEKPCFHDTLACRKIVVQRIVPRFSPGLDIIVHELHHSLHILSGPIVVPLFGSDAETVDGSFDGSEKTGKIGIPDLRVRKINGLFLNQGVAYLIHFQGSLEKSLDLVLQGVAEGIADVLHRNPCRGGPPKIRKRSDSCQKNHENGSKEDDQPTLDRNEFSRATHPAPSCSDRST
ncbi:hypothetical protein SDC9_72150 [bioreactor metagenome]|uniref:Uncharacterized protein n=1 Tax=bioreactor metagenome TaxID=1076179 RepID=A0A644YAK9_9ZZZZ